MKNTTKYGLLILTLLMGTGLATAGDTARYWAETGDHVGLFNHWTASIEVLDDYGYENKAAEDWGLFDQHAFSGVFAWNKAWDTGRWLTLRGAGDNRGENGTGSFSLDGGSVGVFTYSADYRSFNHYYDGSSETMYPMTVAPDDLGFRPDLRWSRAGMDTRYRLNDKLTLNFDLDEIRRSGEKGSLARSARGAAVPGVKEFETESLRATVSADWRAGGVHGDLGVTYGKDDGTRDLRDTHAYSDDRISTVVKGGVAWNGEGLTLLGRFAAGQVDLTPAEAASSGGQQNVDVEQSSKVGTVAALWRPSPTLGLTVSTNVQKVETDGTTDGGEVANLDRERTRKGFRANLKWVAPARTRVAIGFRYDVNELLETLIDTDGLTTAATTDQERTTTTLTLKAKRRFSKDLSAKAEVRTSQLDIVQTETGDLRHWQGDRERKQTKASLGLNYAPMPGVRMDMGGQMIRQTFERTDITGVENTFDADRGYATVSWLATDRITVLGNVSYGNEVYDLPEGVEPAADTAAVVYDTTTMRFTPGVMVNLGAGWRMEGHWEAVRNTDSVENDYDRWYAQASWDMNERMTLTGLFRKYEYDENRWDDYILDLYAVSVSARF